MFFVMISWLTIPWSVLIWKSGITLRMRHVPRRSPSRFRLGGDELRDIPLLVGQPAGIDAGDGARGGQLAQWWDAAGIGR